MYCAPGRRSFPDLGQPTAAGPRIYGRADVERVLRIRELVYVEGLTLAGARRRLEEVEAGATTTAADDFVLVDEHDADADSRRAAEVCRACSIC